MKKKISDTGIKKYTSTKARSLSPGILLRVSIGGVPGFIGLVFFLMGTMFMFIFGCLVDFNGFKLSDNSPRTSGLITDVRSTNSSLNEQRVYAFYYVYITPDGLEFKNISYSEEVMPEKGDTVTVVYAADSPEISKIEDMRTGSFPPYILLFLLIFPLMGGILLFVFVRKGISRIHILKYGKVAYGKYKSKYATNMKINDRTVFALKFEFTTPDDKTFIVESRTHQPERLQDESLEKLVYLPYAPEEAVLIDSLPRLVRRFLKE